MKGTELPGIIPVPAFLPDPTGKGLPAPTCGTACHLAIAPKVRLPTDTWLRASLRKLDEMPPVLSLLPNGTGLSGTTPSKTYPVCPISTGLLAHARLTRSIFSPLRLLKSNCT